MYTGYEEDYGKPLIAVGNYAFYREVKTRPVNWLIEGLLKERGIGMLYGSTGAMKSFAAVDIACRVANGMPVAGKPTQQTEVLYIAGEASEETWERIEAWKKFHGKSNGPIVCNWARPIHTSEIEHLIEATLELNAGLVIIDNLADATVGLALSNPDEVGEYLKPNILGFVKQAKAAILMLHHTGHNDRDERGARVLRDMADTTIKAFKNTDYPTKYRWEVQKLRRVPQDQWYDFFFEIADVEDQTGIDNAGVVNFLYQKSKDNKVKAAEARVSAKTLTNEDRVCNYIMDTWPDTLIATTDEIEDALDIKTDTLRKIVQRSDRLYKPENGLIGARDS